MQNIVVLQSRNAQRVFAVSIRHSTTTSSTQNSKEHKVKPFRSILIANRGEIALRVGRTAAEFGIRTTTIYTDPDRDAQHALVSPFNINLGAKDQYLNGSRIIAVAKDQGCDAVHPGYGFLSENADFAKQCLEAGLIFIGPPWKAILSMGDKARSKDIMTTAGVPCIPGYHGSMQDPDYLAEQADKIGYPVLLKAVKGGGGKGMRIVYHKDEFQQQLASAKSEAKSSFGDEVMLIEKYITAPRHIEVQIFADKHGNCIALGERDCSIQRRHQKILEESPAPNLDEDVRQQLWDKARKAALAVGYEGAGTVEFIFDNDSGEFFFMEMNTRLQVEHPVTEMVTGLDLVHWQILVAEGRQLPLTQAEVHERIVRRGHAIEARIYAENPALDFIPSTGTLVHLRTPPASESVRVDAGFVQGDEISSHYDPMIAKLIVHGSDRITALKKLERALEQYEVAGVITNIDFLKRCARSADFVDGNVETGYITKHAVELFAVPPISNEVWFQAAIALLNLKYPALSSPSSWTYLDVSMAAPQQRRELHLINLDSEDKKVMKVHVTQLEPGKVLVGFYDDKIGQEVVVRWDKQTASLRTLFEHTAIQSHIVSLPIISTDPTVAEQYALFQYGHMYRIGLVAPSWIPAALGTKDVTNSVLAPMPCMVIRVHVKSGERVIMGQSLLVVESMKMETVIRAPHDGVVKRIVRGAGTMAQAGVALVEFEEAKHEDRVQS